MADQNIEIDIRQALGQISDLRNSVVALQGEMDKVSQSSRRAFEPIPATAKAAQQAMGQLSEAIKKDADALEEVNKALKDMESQSQATSKRPPIGPDAAKNASALRDQAIGVTGAISDIAGATDRLTIAQRVFNAVAKANPLGLILTALAAVIGSVITYFARFQGALDKVNQVSAGLQAVLGVLIDRVVRFGEAIVKFTTGDFSGSVDSLGKAFGNLTVEISAAYGAAAALEKQLQQLEDAEIANITAFAKRQQQVEKLKSIADDETKSVGARIKAVRQAAAEESALYTDRIKQAEAFLQNQRDTLEQSGLQRDERRQIAEAEKSLIELQGEADRARISNQAKINELQKQGAKAAKKEAEETQKDLEKIAATIEKLRVATQDEGIDREIAVINKKYDDLGNAAQEGIDKLNQIEAKRGLGEAQIQQREELQNLQIELEEQRLSALTSALLDFNARELQLEEEQNKAREALRKRDIEAAQKSIGEVRALQLQQADFFEAQGEAYAKVLRDRGASEAEIQEVLGRFQYGANKKRLEAQLQFEQALLATIDQSDTAQIDLVKAKIATLQQQIAGLDIKPIQGKPKSLLELIGLSGGPEDDKLIQEAAAKIIGALKSIAAANVEAAQAAVDAADQRVRAAEEALDREIELAEAGVASNVSLRQQELLDAQAARERALEDSKRAQRQQLALDTVTQASGIATSVANIIKGWSSVPFVGFLLAAAQVAALFALVSSTRARAKAISTQQFRRGGSGYVDENGVIVGASHEAGGVTVPEYEGGEFFGSDGKRFAVVNRKMTAKHFDLLKAINSDDRVGMAAALRRLTSAPSLRRDISVGAGPSASGSSQGGDGFTPQERKQILRLLAQQNETTKNRPIVTREGNDTVIRQGNHTRRIKNA